MREEKKSKKTIKPEAFENARKRTRHYMANLPNDELGQAIINEISNAPPPDRERLRKEAAEIEARIIAARRKSEDD